MEKHWRNTAWERLVQTPLLGRFLRKYKQSQNSSVAPVPFVIYLPWYIHFIPVGIFVIMFYVECKYNKDHDYASTLTNALLVGFAYYTVYYAKRVFELQRRETTKRNSLEITAHYNSDEQVEARAKIYGFWHDAKEETERNQGPQFRPFAGRHEILAWKVDRVGIEKYPQRILNYYEDIHYGIQHGLYDETIIYETLGHPIISHFEMLIMYIKSVRVREGEGYEGVEKLVARYKAMKKALETTAKE